MKAKEIEALRQPLNIIGLAVDNIKSVFMLYRDVDNDEELAPLFNSVERNILRLDREMLEMLESEVKQDV